ncbi:uncharacterized protein LOC143989729 [Lithobates pipiens]
MPSCFVKSCSLNWRNDTIRLHSFPRHRGRIKTWLERLNVPGEELESLVETISKSKFWQFKICSRHFSENDYEIRGTQKLLKNMAYPSLQLDKGFETCHAELEHNYPKRRRTENERPSQSSINISDTSRSGATQTSMETSSELQDNSRASVSEVSDCEIVWCQFEDSDLVESVICSSVATEPIADIDLSAKPGEIPNTTKTISSRAHRLKQKRKVTKIHRGVQCQLKKEVKTKKIQVSPAKPIVSIAIQCSLVKLPPLTLMPTLRRSMLEFVTLEKTHKDVPQSPFSGTFTLETNRELEHVEKGHDAPAIHCDPNVFILGLSPIKSTSQESKTSAGAGNNEFDLLLTPQEKKKDKDKSYRPSKEEEGEEEEMYSEELEEEHLNFDLKEPRLSSLYVQEEKEPAHVASQSRFFWCLKNAWINY